MKSIKTQNQPAYRWSALWPLKLWVRGLYNSWWFCGHKLSIFIYLSMGICHFAKVLLDDKKTIKSNFNSLWIQFHFMDHFSVLWITSQFYRSLLSFMDHFSVLWIPFQFEEWIVKTVDCTCVHSAVNTSLLHQLKEEKERECWIQTDKS